MQAKDLLKKLESQDKHQIMDAVWGILDCTNKSILTELLPHVSSLKKQVKKVDMGGMVYKNSDHFLTAMNYIKTLCDGGCYCSLFQSTSLFGPESQEDHGHVRIVSRISNVELFEVNFEVECLYCQRRYSVREVHGWHVPWYEWIQMT